MAHSQNPVLRFHILRNKSLDEDGWYLFSEIQWQGREKDRKLRDHMLFREVSYLSPSQLTR